MVGISRATIDILKSTVTSTTVIVDPVPSGIIGWSPRTRIMLVRLSWTAVTSFGGDIPGEG